MADESFRSKLEIGAGLERDLLQDSLDTGAGVRKGTIRAGAYTYLGYYTTAIPEPETYGMLLAGLLVVGSVARRRTPSRTPRKA